MENIANKINERLNKIKQMIQNEEKRDKIEQERKELDKLLEKYLEEM